MMMIPMMRCFRFMLDTQKLGKFLMSWSFDLLKLLWNWQGPARVRTFLWKLTHERLLTNEERAGRHMAIPLASDAVCPQSLLCMRCGIAMGSAVSGHFLSKKTIGIIFVAVAWRMA